MGRGAVPGCSRIGRNRDRRAAARLRRGEAGMRLSFAGDRVLAVVAHPDDAELLCAGTLARARSEGATVGVAVCCRGDKGQPAQPIRNLAAVRKKEMTAAAKLLDAELFPCGFADGTLVDGRKQRLA